MPGRMKPLTGLMDNSGGKLFVFHWNLVNRRARKKKINQSEARVLKDIYTSAKLVDKDRQLNLV